MFGELVLILVVLIGLLLLGLVQAVRLVVWLFTGSARRRGETQQTAIQLRKLFEKGYINKETYQTVASGLAAASAQIPPAAAANFATRQSIDPSGELDVVPLAPAAMPPPPLPTRAPKKMAQLRPIVPPARSESASSSRPGIFASFLEHRNIRWGELLGGLLILGCSTALVVSFWADIADRPIFKFALLTLVTAAFFGVGLYSEHRWKLPTTSRAILLLSMLLVPVNLLAFAAFGSLRQTGNISLIAQLVSLGIFTLLIWPAARSC